VTGRRSVGSLWEVGVRADLDADLVGRLEEELAIDFFALAKPHEFVVGQRTLHRDDDGTVVLLIEQHRDDAGFSFRLLSSVAHEAAGSYPSLRRACEHIAADLDGGRGLAVVARAIEEGGALGEDEDFASALIALAAIRAETSVRLAGLHAELNRDLDADEFAVLNPNRDGPSDDKVPMSLWVGDRAPVPFASVLLLVQLIAMSYLMTQLPSVALSTLTSAIAGASGFGTAAAAGSLLGRILRLRRVRAPYIDRVEQLALVVLVTTAVLLPLAGGLPPTADAQVLVVAYVTLFCLTMSITYLVYVRLHQSVPPQETATPDDGQSSSTSASQRSIALRRSVAEAETIIATALVEAVDYFQSEVDRHTVQHVELLENFDIVPPAWLRAARTELAEREAPQETPERQALPSGENPDSPAT
jgi:hypothetical protein